MPAALALLATGAFLVISNIMTYMQVTEYGEAGWAPDESGNYVYWVNTATGWKPLTEVEREYVDFYVYPVIIAAAGAGLLILYAKRNYLKAKHII